MNSTAVNNLFTCLIPSLGYERRSKSIVIVRFMTPANCRICNPTNREQNGSFTTIVSIIKDKPLLFDNKLFLYLIFLLILRRKGKWDCQRCMQHSFQPHLHSTTRGFQFPAILGHCGRCSSGIIIQRPSKVCVIHTWLVTVK